MFRILHITSKGYLNHEIPLGLPERRKPQPVFSLASDLQPLSGYLTRDRAVRESIAKNRSFNSINKTTHFDDIIVTNFFIIRGDTRN